MTQSKQQKQAKAKAAAALYKQSPYLWALQQGIGPGSIIWGIHPGCKDGQFMDLKAHPFLILSWQGEQAILLPLSESKAKGSKPYFGKALAPTNQMSISAPAWDCILLATPQPFWKAAANPHSDIANQKAGKAYIDQRIKEMEIAIAKGIAKIWKAGLINPTQLPALKQSAKQQGNINKKGKACHSKPGCLQLA